MRLALDGSISQNIAGAEKAYGLGFHATISVNTATLMER